MRVMTMAVAALTMLAAGEAGRAATIGVGGVSTTVAPGAAGPLQCVLNALVARGYPVRFLGGLSRGHMPGSLHHTGMAMDVNQTARNVTRPRMPPDEAALAEGCGAVSGAAWRGSPDSGHFQVGGWAGRGHRQYVDMGTSETRAAGLDLRGYTTKRKTEPSFWETLFGAPSVPAARSRRRHGR
jgi:hypothetical protein